MASEIVFKSRVKPEDGEKYKCELSCMLGRSIAELKVLPADVIDGEGWD